MWKTTITVTTIDESMPLSQEAAVTIETQTASIVSDFKASDGAGTRYPAALDANGNEIPFDREMNSVRSRVFNTEANANAFASQMQALLAPYSDFITVSATVEDIGSV